jgi:oxygen-independent coproporphyrinogen-3 oxidase
MTPDDGPIRHLYVHAPFCARRCFYCDFAVTVDRSPRTGAWLEALEAELDMVQGEGSFALAASLDTVYVGGGTPSLLGPQAMTDLARVVGRDRLGSQHLEWTAEANPESFTPELGRAWRRAGVSRVSLGIQSFHEMALTWMGRMHGPDGARRSVRVAREAGLTNFSVDLIFALPAHLERSWRRDLEQALKLEPPHVSLYGLTVESRTPLGRAVSEGREDPIDEARYREEFLLASELLRGAGYEHYEVSNFARPGCRARHNAAYWAGVPYLGLGNGAHSYLHPVRRWNLREWPDYQERVEEGHLPVEGEETLSSEADRLERTWLGLRTSSGLDASTLTEAGVKLWRRWISQGLARPGVDRVVLTPEGWLLLDRLAVELDQAEGGGRGSEGEGAASRPPVSPGAGRAGD